MTIELEDHMRECKYRVVSVEKTDPPEGMPEGDWYHYVIEQGDSKIEGYKPGTLYAVTEHAETFAEDLNARAANGYSVYASRKRK